MGRGGGDDQQVSLAEMSDFYPESLCESPREFIFVIENKIGI